MAVFHAYLITTPTGAIHAVHPDGGPLCGCRVGDSWPVSCRGYRVTCKRCKVALAGPDLGPILKIHFPPSQ